MFFGYKSRIYQEYKTARRMFHQGNRVKAIPSFVSVLDHPDMDLVPKIDAACSIGETYRGIGDFQKAKQYYKLAVSFSDKVPPRDQRRNEYFRHYSPRAYLGLIITMRRTLDKEHHDIFKLLKEAKDKFSNFQIPDLNAQLTGLEGLYLRQLGENQSSISYLEECIEEMNDISLDYVLFLYKEHYQALLLMSYACQSGNNLRAVRLGRKLLKEDIATWSTAVAAMSILHVQLKKAYRFEKINQGQLDEKIFTEIENSFNTMREAATFEQDPLILTEAYILEIAWAIITKEYHKLNNALTLFYRTLSNVTEPIFVLRAIELAILQDELKEAIPEYDTTVEKSIQEGQILFDKWYSAFQSFQCELDIMIVWKNILTGKGTEHQYNISMLFHNNLYQLRQRVWS